MDLSQNYSLKSWFRSLGDSRRDLQVFLLSPILAGLLFMVFEWIRTVDDTRIALKEAVPLEESYYEVLTYSLRIEEIEEKEITILTVKEKPEYGYYFGLGAFIGFLISGVSIFRMDFATRNKSGGDKGATSTTP